jgi:hypothetical protein
VTLAKGRKPGLDLVQGGRKGVVRRNHNGLSIYKHSARRRSCRAQREKLPKAAPSFQANAHSPLTRSSGMHERLQRRGAFPF